MKEEKTIVLRVEICLDYIETSVQINEILLYYSNIKQNRVFYAVHSITVISR